MRCSTGLGQCPLTPEIPRRCGKCRLERCLAVGMRKDFFVSEEEKERRRERLESRRLALQASSASASSPAQLAADPELLSSAIDEIDRVSLSSSLMQLTRISSYCL